MSRFSAGIVSGLIPAVTFSLVANYDAIGYPQTDFTFPSVPFGDAAAGRKMVLAYGNGGSGVATSSIMLGGNTMTLAKAAGSGNPRAGIYYVDLATSTSGDLDFAFASAEYRVGWALYRVIGAASGGPSDTGSDTGSDPLSASLTVPAKGAAIGAGFHVGSNGFAWTNLTEDIDTLAGDSSGAFTAASALFASGSTPTIECNPPSSSASMALSAWGPA